MATVDRLDALFQIEENRDSIEALGRQLETSVGVIPFVGAGLSMACGLPGWTQLLLQLAGSAGASSVEIESLIHAGEYELAAETAVTAIGDEVLRDTIRSKFGIDQSELAGLVGPIRRLPELFTGPVITTNFDYLLERCYQSHSTPFQQVITAGSHLDAIMHAIDANRRVLIKLHGDAEMRAEQVVTKSDYQRHYHGANTDPMVLVISRRPMMFLGCSLNADRTIRALKGLRIPPIHFAMVGLPHADILGRRRLLIDSHIRAIWYPTGDHSAIEVLLDYLIQRHKLVRRAATHQISKQPYKFLDYYDVNESHLFFGRTDEIQTVYQKIRQQKLTVLCGHSGCGKTSLVRAGILPKLADEGWTTIYARCGDDPLFQIKEAVRREFSGHADLHAYLKRPLSELLAFISAETRRPLTILIDQFEELFYLPQLTITNFVNEMAKCEKADLSALHVAVIVRSEHLSRVDKLQNWIDNPLQYTTILEGLSESGAENAIVGPAALAGLSYEAGLVRRLVTQLQEHSAKEEESRILPTFLQIVCTRIADAKIGHNRKIVWEDVQALGGVEGIISGYAEHALSTLDEEHLRRAWKILKRATTVESAKTILTAPALCEDESDSDTLDILCTRRLMRKVDDDHFELAHDRLAATVRARMTLHEQKAVDFASMARFAYKMSKEYDIEPAEDLARELPKYANDEMFRLEPEVLDWAKQRAERTRTKRVWERIKWMTVAIAIVAAAVAAVYFSPRLLVRKPSMPRVLVSAGPFEMGRPGDGASSPRHKLIVGPYWIAKFEVSNEDYRRYVRGTRSPAPESPQYNNKAFELHPVLGVSWFEARNFCEWVGGRLPTEAEWEKAATWDPVLGRKRMWPWGDTWDEKKMKSLEGGSASTAAIDTLQEGASAYGVFNLVGNAAEWTSSIFKPYPYVSADGREDRDSVADRVMRGSSYANIPGAADPTNRSGLNSAKGDPQVGFRCVWDVR